MNMGGSGYLWWNSISFSLSLCLCLRSAAAAKSLQSCPTLCDPIDGSPPGSPDPGILQARAMEWVAISFSNAWKWKVKLKSLSHVRLLATPWTAAYRAPPSMGYSRQEYWSGVPLPQPNSSSWDIPAIFIHSSHPSHLRFQTLWIRDTLSLLCPIRISGLQNHNK